MDIKLVTVRHCDGSTECIGLWRICSAESFRSVYVGPPLRNALLCCSSRFNAIAPCSIACATSSCMPPNRNASASCSIACASSSRMLIQSQRCRAMLTGVRNVVAHAHLLSVPSRHAHSYAKGRRACSSSCNAITSCPLACATSSRMPTQPERHRAMPTGVRKLIWQRSGWPNRRLQRTALRAREIRAFLKRSFGSTAFPISNAPPLKRNTLGGALKPY
jgi:hypothetical protein